MHLDFKSFGIGLAVGAVAMLVVGLALLFTAAWAINKNKAAAAGPAPAFCPAAGDPAVTQLLKPIRQKFNVPAMAAAVVTSDGIKFVGAVGVRKRGTGIPVGLDDLWHLGSDGKIMTSTLMARLVEGGRLRWDTTLAEIFPDLASQMNPQFRNVTLLQLLSHRAGLPANVDLAQYLGDEATALRLRVVREELAKSPQSVPGTKFLYSNVGYMIAGAVGEKITGQPWEVAISNEVFQPLQMKSAGFGGLGTPGKIDQPWPHTADGEPTAENGPAMDNPPVMGPAGRIHCTIQDWAKFVQDQLRGARGEAALLKPESYKKLQTPPFGGDYALGWTVVQRSWGGGTVFCHQGDNTMNCANVWVAPKKNFAILVCVNQSGDTAFQASDEAVGALMGLLR
ncbi:MAG TPA: serine hydrolase domain-containing protein [Verrucomicrobiae bacterium]|nr:serine hydrolase domain-containing protein [Verrucomicrobiae bacterium]